MSGGDRLCRVLSDLEVSPWRTATSRPRKSPKKAILRNISRLRARRGVM